MYCTYFKVSIYVFGHDVLGLGLVLTIDDVHVKFALRAKEEWTELGHIFAAFFDGLQENAIAIEWIK